MKVSTAAKDKDCLPIGGSVSHRAKDCSLYPERDVSWLASQAPRSSPPNRFVDHTYRDFANYPIDEISSRKRIPTNFPSKLHEILSNSEFSHIISWMPHGRAWKIHNKELLIKEVVPKFFGQSKYESFARQIVGWGFKRLHQSGNDFNAYYHECFLSGLPRLTALMKRVPPNQGKLLPHVEGEPNFYEICVQYPLPSQSIPRQGKGYPYLMPGAAVASSPMLFCHPVSPDHSPRNSFVEPPRRPAMHERVCDPNSLAAKRSSGLLSYRAFLPRSPHHTRVDNQVRRVSHEKSHENEGALPDESILIPEWNEIINVLSV